MVNYYIDDANKFFLENSVLSEGVKLSSKSLIIKNKEIYGKFLINTKKSKTHGKIYLYIDSNSLILSDVQMKGHNSCKNKCFSKYIFHTHVYNDKPYPSMKDIMKVIKYKKYIKTNIIITTWGIWYISNSDDTMPYIKGNDKNKDAIRTFITHFTNRFHYLTINSENIRDVSINDIYRDIDRKYEFDHIIKRLNKKFCINIVFMPKLK